MSGGKGTQQTGSATTSQTNPLAKYVTGAADYLTPYAQDPNRPYTAPPNPLQTAGYQNLADTGANLGGWPMAKQYDAYGNLITGGGTSPAYGGYAQMAAGGSGPQQTSDRVVNNAVNVARGYGDTIADYGNKAAAYGQGYADTMAGYANRATGGNLGLSQLGDVASGKFTNAASNPYLRDMVNAALRPVSENYQTSTAPTLDARFSAGGRYGSGAADVAAGSARDAFARNLGEISTSMYGKAYSDERTRQDTAAYEYDQARRAGLGLGITGNQAASEAARMGYSTGIAGNQAAGNLVDQGERTALSAADLTQRGQTAGLAGLDTGFRTGLSTQEQTLRDYNSFAQGQMIPAQADIQAGTGLRALDQSMLQEPYDKVAAYLKAISGGGSAGSSTTQPIFGNPLTSAISGASGILGLGKELGLGSAASSLFGGAAGGTDAVLSGIGSGALPAVLAPDIGAAGLSSLAALNAGTSIAPALAAAAAPAAFTIVCTELVKQGRMPDIWRRSGMRQFMRYPAIARRGYWVWATPVVAHLRQKPDSRFSKVIERTFNWRAEDLAARNGVKGARRLLRGRLVTAAMVLPCLACGLVARRDYWPIVKDVKI